VAYRLAFIGFGTVGQGLAEILLDKREALRSQYGFEWEVVAISDITKGAVYSEKGLDLSGVLSVLQKTGRLDGYSEGIKGWDSLKTIRETNADVIIEVTFTNIETAEPALSHVKTALSLGKHVVTSNKGPAALALEELTNLAKEKGVFFKFEGAVMSGTPLISVGLNGLAGSEIQEIRGILNGTTNYILTEMEKGKTYEEALREAQRLGYAEAVPDADVEGWDALAKILILANALMKANLKVKDVEREGITKITPSDIEEARREGKRWKLIARAQREGGKVTAQVRPQALPLEDPLAQVMGVTNALTFRTDLLGGVTVIGPGAGRKETGFALLTDLLEIHRYLSHGSRS